MTDTILAKLLILEREINRLGRRAAIWQFAFWIALWIALAGWMR